MDNHGKKGPQQLVPFSRGWKQGAGKSRPAVVWIFFFSKVVGGMSFLKVIVWLIDFVLSPRKISYFNCTSCE